MNHYVSVALAATLVSTSGHLLAQDAADDFPDALESDASEPAPSEPAPPEPETAEANEAAEATDTANGNEQTAETIPVGPLVAEESPLPEAPRRTGSRMLEEIVVTAQKREERSQDVPIAIAAFSADRLEASGIQSTIDLPAVTPGLSISSSAGYSLIYLRGIGTSAFIPSFDPSVATYVDGIYIPSQQGTLTDLGGVERVEVLKGPQGTLFGRNSTGGAINVITKQPGRDFELSLSAEAGNFSSEKYKGYVAFPLTDTLSMSVSGVYTSRDAYYTVVDDPQSVGAAPDYDLDPEVSRGGRVRLLWTPTDDFELVLTGYRILSSGSEGLGDINTKPGPAFAGIINPPGDYRTSANIEPKTTQRTTAFYGATTYSTPWTDIKLFAAYQDQKAYGNIYDFDGSQLNLATFNGPNQPSELVTAELQFLSNERGWTPDWLTWIGGLYFLTQEAGYDPFFATVGDGLGLIQPLNDILQSLGDLPIDLGDGAIDLGASGVLETNSYSVFAQSTVTFTDWLALTLGARYQEEDRFLIKQETFANVAGLGQIPTFRFNQPKRNQYNVSPKATLELRPFDGVLAYLTWARGFKSGSYSIVTLYTVPDFVEPEEVTSTEFGIKTTPIEGLTFNAAVFDNRIKDLQETLLALTSGGAISAENAEEARTRGAEFDAVWVPFVDWNPGLVVTAGATYVEAEYTEYNEASGFDEVTGIAFGNTAPLPARDFAGNRIARTPKISGFFGLSQTLDIPGGPLELAADVYHSGDFFFTAQNTDNTLQEAYSLVGARASYLYERAGLRFSAFVRNLTDERYVVTSTTVDFGVLERLGLPRTYGLTVAYEFN